MPPKKSTIKKITISKNRSITTNTNIDDIVTIPNDNSIDDMNNTYSSTITTGTAIATGIVKKSVKTSSVKKTSKPKSEPKQNVTTIEHKLKFSHNNNNNILEAGIDEAGRGCYIGDVYAAAVIFDPKVIEEKGDLFKKYVKDSKKFANIEQRKEAYAFVIDNCVAWGVGSATSVEIDNMNILKANMLAMHRAVKDMYINPDYLLVDGNYFETYTDHNNNPISYSTIPHGDDLYYSIAGASIIAKVSRDNYIEDLCDSYPELEVYNLRNNHGYGTSDHEEAMREHGISRFHRKSFRPCAKYIV